ncbi:MAG: Uma2 family endonuclease [Gemmatimonadales bacterium]
MAPPAPPAPTYWTAQMVRDLPDDGNRYEVVYGELLVTPAPRPWHEILFGRLIVALNEYLRREPVGIVLGSRADISWGPDVLVQPDVFVVPLAQARTLDWTQYRDLLLVAEVLSPSSARSDRFLKRRLYQEAGIPRYWIVDGDQQQVEVWTPESRFPHLERARPSWHPAGAATEFSLPLEDLFRPL